MLKYQDRVISLEELAREQTYLIKKIVDEYVFIGEDRLYIVKPMDTKFNKFEIVIKYMGGNQNARRA